MLTRVQDYMNRINTGMNKQDLDLFSRAVVMMDLDWMVEQDMKLPFKLTPEQVPHEMEKINRAVRVNSRVREALNTRQIQMDMSFGRR